MFDRTGLIKALFDSKNEGAIKAFSWPRQTRETCHGTDEFFYSFRVQQRQEVYPVINPNKYQHEFIHKISSMCGYTTVVPLPVIIRLSVFNG